MTELIKTKDGSYTLYDSTLKVYYHSIHGAVQESKHVFIGNGLNFLFQNGKNKLRILEIGFGTGLNAVLSMHFSNTFKIPIDYTGLEPHPPEALVIEKYIESHSVLFDQKTLKAWKKINSEAYDKNFINDYFECKIHQSEFQKFESSDKYDLIYWDAFAFDSQPEMWDSRIFKKLKAIMNTDGILVTYAAKGIIKRNLKSVGFKVESLQGPPGKREMIRAHFVC
ncbi:MAG: tRNA (5-methylaminomethyl-2-thiouridine)(34)-methyltransferase MnmD [Bacteroidota bacterium]